MKKYFASVLTLLLLVIVPTFVSAEPADIDPSPVGSSCLSLNSNMGYGASDAKTNSEVSFLQDFLNAQGLFNQEPTGFIGRLTVAAVKNFQRLNGISPTGYVGLYTRTKIKDITCLLPDQVSKNTSQLNTNISAPTPTNNINSRPHVSLRVNNSQNSVITVTENTPLTISWVSVGAISCSSSGGFSNWESNSRQLSGSAEPRETAQVSSTFTITCTNGSYLSSDSVRVNVKEGTAPIISFTANNASDTLDIIENRPVTFLWYTSNADSCSSSGGTSNWQSSNRPTSGSAELRDPIDVSATYTITCRNSAGISVSRSIRVNVKEDQSTIGITFTANGSENVLTMIEGTPLTFSWVTTNADSCLSSGGFSNWPSSNRATSGLVELRDPITVSQMFTLTCTNSFRLSSTKSIQVNVREAN